MAVAMAAPHLTLYYGPISPWCQRVRILLHESGAKWDEILIDLKNKPPYLAKLNPIQEVPAITYGDSPIDEVPSPTAFSLAESSVIAEFVADLYPNSGILPSSPIDRAKIRFFIDKATKGFIPTLGALAWAGAPHQTVLEHVDALQALLDPTLKYLVGDRITLAEATVAPFLISLYTMGKPELGLSGEGEMAKLLAALKEEKYAVFAKYTEAIITHPTVKNTFNEEGFIAQWANAA